MKKMKCQGPNIGEFISTSDLECDTVWVPECIDATPVCHDLPPKIVGGNITITNNPSPTYRRKNCKTFKVYFPNF